MTGLARAIWYEAFRLTVKAQHPEWARHYVSRTIERVSWHLRSGQSWDDAWADEQLTQGIMHLTAAIYNEAIWASDADPSWPRAVTSMNYISDMRYLDARAYAP